MYEKYLIFDDDHDTSLRYSKWFDSLSTGDHLLI